MNNEIIPMEILNLVQGSDEWLAARLDNFCASEAPVIMGDSPYMTRNGLLDAKKGWNASRDSSFKEKLFQRGHGVEKIGRQNFEIELLMDFPPLVGKRLVSGMDLLASFDGFNQCPLEIKLLNTDLLENVRNETLEPKHYWQLEHQMIVAGVLQCYFMCCDEIQSHYFMYHSIRERRDQLVAGWLQFKDDLESHELKAKVSVPVAAEYDVFPMLDIKVNGSEIITNIDPVLAQVKLLAEQENNKQLTTDQHFVDKKKVNDAVKLFRKEMKRRKAALTDEFKELRKVLKVFDEIEAILQPMQSKGEKLYNTENKRRKDELLEKGIKKVNDFIISKNFILSKFKSKGPKDLSGISQVFYDMSQCIKGKSNFQSMVDSIDQKVSELKIEFNADMDIISANYQYIDLILEANNKYSSLFPDIKNYLLQNNETFREVMDSRIIKYEQELKIQVEAEIKRKQEQKEREEKAKKEKQEREEKERQRNKEIDERLKKEREESQIKLKKEENLYKSHPKSESNHERKSLDGIERAQSLANPNTPESVNKKLDDFIKNGPQRIKDEVLNHHLNNDFNSYLAHWVDKWHINFQAELELKNLIETFLTPKD